MGKTDFPHHEAKRLRDLEKVFKEWEMVYINYNLNKKRIVLL